MKLIGFICATALLSLAACGSDSSGKPSCEAIVEACHEKDPGTGPIHDCHENAESVVSTEAMCAQAKDACVALCEAAPIPADAGPGADAGPTADAALPDAQ